jgi:hypothetical protein
MSQADFFAVETATLFVPVWYCSAARDEIELSHTVGDYKVTPGDRWKVTLLKTGATIYEGIGPVEIRRTGAR